MPATVDHNTHGALLIGPGGPPILVQSTARLECGCACHVGLRVDNREPATGAIACSDAHDVLMDFFSNLVEESTIEPHPTKSMVDVAAELLSKAEGFERLDRATGQGRR